MGVGFRGGRRQDRKGIAALRFGHDEQLVPVIFPVAEVDDERMAAVMFAQQRDGQPLREDPFEGGEDVLPHVIVSVGHPMFVAQLLGLRPELLLHDMRMMTIFRQQAQQTAAVRISTCDDSSMMT